MYATDMVAGQSLSVCLVGASDVQVWRSTGAFSLQARARKKVRKVSRRSSDMLCTDVDIDRGMVTTGVVRSLRTCRPEPHRQTGSLGTACSPTTWMIDVRAWHLRRQYNLGGEKLGTQDRQLPLINWSEPRHCVMQEGSAVRPWAGPPRGRTICSSRPPQARSAMQVVTSHTPLSPCFKGSFLARRSTPRKCESRGKCLKANATCAQNAILAVRFLPSIKTSMGSGQEEVLCRRQCRVKEGQDPPESEAHGAPKAKRRMG